MGEARKKDVCEANFILFLTSLVQAMLLCYNVSKPVVIHSSELLKTYTERL